MATPDAHHAGGIRREERHLRARFGEELNRYRRACAQPAAGT